MFTCFLLCSLVRGVGIMKIFPFFIIKLIATPPLHLYEVVLYGVDHKAGCVF